MSEKVRITFLGTSGMIPDEQRSHPAFFLSYAGEGILVDCGEGTQTQFKKAGLSMNKITKILITHWHGDHTLGLPGLLKTLSMSSYTRKLMIYGPKNIGQRIKEMFLAFGSITEYPIEVKEVSGKFFENSEFYLAAEAMTHGTPCNAYSFVLKDKLKIDKAKLRKLKIKPGKHLADLKSKGYMTYNGKKFKAKDLAKSEPGKKASFILDTTSNRKIVPFVAGSDILVCEASFSNELAEKAREYGHLTSGEAGKIAREAKVKKLFLVHVSQRHSKAYGQIATEAKKHFKNVVIPKDLDFVEF